MELLLISTVGVIAAVFWLTRTRSEERVPDDKELFSAASLTMPPMEHADGAAKRETVKTEIDELFAVRESLTAEVNLLRQHRDEISAETNESAIQLERIKEEVNRLILIREALEAENQRLRDLPKGDAALADSAIPPEQREGLEHVFEEERLRREAALEGFITLMRNARILELEQSISQMREEATATLHAEIDQLRDAQTKAIEESVDLSALRSERLVEMETELAGLRAGLLSNLHTEIDAVREDRLAALGEEEAALRRAVDVDVKSRKESAFAEVTDWIARERQRVTAMLERDYQLEVERRRAQRNLT